MTYWQVAIGLSGLAVLFILWPFITHWWRRDEDKYAQARVVANTRLYEEHLAELQQQLENGDVTDEEFATLKREQQRALLEDAGEQPAIQSRRDGLGLLIVVAVLVPVVAWVAYHQLGARDDWEIHQLVEEWQNSEQPDAQLEARLREELTRRLQTQPDNTQNWYLLATLALNVQDYDQAVEAFKQIVEREPTSARILAELAQAQFLQAGNQVTPEVRRNTERALEINPDMPTALGLAGIDAFQQGYFRRAIQYWSHAVDLVGTEAPGATALMNGIARAQAELEASGEASEEIDAADAGAKLTVEVSLGEGVTVAPSATVFVYARAFQGARMPLAIRRFPASELPKTVVLKDSDAMAPGSSMSDSEQLEVVARISPSGNAIPQSGDWQAVQAPVELADGEAQVALVVSETIP